MRLVLICFLIFSAETAMARLPQADAASARQEIQTIAAFVNHLNHYYPRLSLSLTASPATAAERQVLLHELQLLEGSLRGEINMQPGSLQMTKCTAPPCIGAT